MLIDSHCHLDLLPEAELPALLRAARAAGVSEMVTIGTTLPQSACIAALAETLEGVWCLAGVHPNQSAEAPIPTPPEIAALMAHPCAIGIGETGLDYHYDAAPPAIQRDSFRAHIRAARESGVPVAIHARDADADMATILEEESRIGTFDFLLHCFSSGPQLAEFAVSLGGYISFSGILTFPRSEALRDLARALPLDRLLVETDAPYLAPVPHRGRPNQPAFVRHTAETLAELRGLSLPALAAQLDDNFRRLFPRACRAEHGARATG